MREANVALLKRGYQAFGKADLDAIREMGAKDEVWHTPGYGPFKPEYKGPDGVTAYLTELMTSSDGTFRTDPEAFAGDDGNHVLVLSTSPRSGRVGRWTRTSFTISESRMGKSPRLRSTPRNRTRSETFGPRRIGLNGKADG